jgi:hypothetical protein
VVPQLWGTILFRYSRKQSIAIKGAERAMSIQSPYDPNPKKRPFGDADLLKIHSPNDTTKEANEENKDHNPGNFNPVRKSFEEKKATANDTTENANKEKNDHKQGKPDLLKNLSKEHRDTSSNDTGEDIHKKSTDHKQEKHDPQRNLFKENTDPNSRDTNKLHKKDIFRDTNRKTVGKIVEEILNQRRLTNNDMKIRGVDPEELNNTCRRLDNLQKSNTVDTKEYKKEYENLIKMLDKLGIRTKK